MLDVARLGRKSFMSQAALSEVLTAVRNVEELPAGVSRHALKRARQAKAGVETPYGKICRTWNLEHGWPSHQRALSGPRGHAVASNQRLQRPRRVSARQIGGRPSFSCEAVGPCFLLATGMLCRPSCGPGPAFGLESSFAWVHTARGSWSPTLR